MTGAVLTPVNVDYLDKLFGWPMIRPVPASELASVPQNDLSAWCHKRAIYQVPTTELIDFLTGEIGNPDYALEIGSGSGHVGRALGIRMSDNMMQDWPHIKEYYQRVKQPTIQYGKDVECIPALSAVTKHQPTTVLACWVTEKLIKGKAEGNMHGVDESVLLSRPPVKKYILVGNHDVHGDKEIIARKRHQVYQFDWLYSRSVHKQKNAIWIFSR